MVHTGQFALGVHPQADGLIDHDHQHRGDCGGINDGDGGSGGLDAQLVANRPTRNGVAEDLGLNRADKQGQADGAEGAGDAVDAEDIEAVVIAELALGQDRAIGDARGNAAQREGRERGRS